MQNKIRLAFCNVAAHCQLMSSFSQSGCPGPRLTQPVHCLEKWAPPSVVCITILRRTLVPRFNYVPHSCLSLLSLGTTWFCFWFCFHKKSGHMMSIRTWTLGQCDGMTQQMTPLFRTVLHTPNALEQEWWSDLPGQEWSVFQAFFLTPLSLYLYAQLKTRVVNSNKCLDP